MTKPVFPAIAALALAAGALLLSNMEARAAYDVRVPATILRVLDSNGLPVQCAEAEVVTDDVREHWGNCGLPPYIWIPCRVSSRDERDTRVIRFHTNEQGEAALPVDRLRSRRRSRVHPGMSITLKEPAHLANVQEWAPGHAGGQNCSVRAEGESGILGMPRLLDCRMDIPREKYYRQKFGGEPRCR